MLKLAPTFAQLENDLQQRILIIDGAMGTMIQKEKLQEADFRAERFKDFHVDVKGNNDLLNLTQPELIYRLHCEYLEAGANIIGTNTFNATSVAQDDYQLGDIIRDINIEGAKLACKARDEYNAKNPNNRRYVAGILGPTPKPLQSRQM